MDESCWTQWHSPGIKWVCSFQTTQLKIIKNPVFSENDILKIPHMQNGSDTEKCCFHTAINKQVQLLVMRIQTQGQNLLRRPSEELGGGRNILQPTQMIIPWLYTFTWIYLWPGVVMWYLQSQLLSRLRGEGHLSPLIWGHADQQSQTSYLNIKIIKLQELWHNSVI